MRTLVDTSSIIFGFENRKSVFESISEDLPGAEPEVSKGIISELNRISDRRGKKGAAASAALNEISAKKVKISNISDYPDSWIAREARLHPEIAVVTNDTKLARSIRGVMVLKMSRNGMLKRFAPRR